MTNAYFYSNTAVETSLSGPLVAGATSMTVGVTTGLPGSYPYILAVDYEGDAEELVKVASAAGSTLTVVRGFGGTSDQDHSAGARVRHVANAQDFTDFRTHEAATSGVHGVSGVLVGESDTQTLTNKTLTTPVINSGTLSGIFAGDATLTGGITLSGVVSASGGLTTSGDFTASGAANLTAGGSLSGTFSGSPTYTGGPTYSGASVLVERAAVTDNAYRARLTGDTNHRILINADGKLIWGPGNASGDVNLYREGADQLTTDNLLRMYRPSASDDALNVRVTGDTLSRLRILGDGSLRWGPGGAGGADTNLYREGVGALSTDSAFQALVIEMNQAPSVLAGWSLSSYYGATTCGVTTIVLNLERTGSDIGETSPGFGNIVDVTAAILPSGWLPPVVFEALWDSGFNDGAAEIDTNGAVILRTTSGSTGINTGNNVRVAMTWVG